MRCYCAFGCDWGAMASPAGLPQPRLWKRLALVGRKKELKEIERQGAVKRKWDGGTLKVDTRVDDQVRKRTVRDLRDSWAAAPRLHRALWFDVMDAGIRLHWHPRVLELFVLNTLGKRQEARERVIRSEVVVCNGDQLWRVWRPCCYRRPVTVDLD